MSCYLLLLPHARPSPPRAARFRQPCFSPPSHRVTLFPLPPAAIARRGAARAVAPCYLCLRPRARRVLLTGLGACCQLGKGAGRGLINGSQGGWGVPGGMMALAMERPLARGGGGGGPGGSACVEYRAAVGAGGGGPAYPCPAVLPRGGRHAARPAAGQGVEGQCRVAAAARAGMARARPRSSLSWGCRAGRGSDARSGPRWHCVRLISATSKGRCGAGWVAGQSVNCKARRRGPASGRIQRALCYRGRVCTARKPCAPAGGAARRGRQPGRSAQARLRVHSAGAGRAGGHPQHHAPRAPGRGRSRRRQRCRRHRCGLLQLPPLLLLPGHARPRPAQVLC